VFFFGNKAGDTFLNSQPTIVQTNINDSLAVRGNGSFLQPVTNIYDFNRDSVVNINDELVARANSGFLTRNLTWNPPAAPLAAAADDGSDGAIATALAAKALPSLPKVPGWISHRLESVDLNSGPAAKLFTALAEANTPTTRSLLLAANEVTNALDLDDSLLESLIAGLN
jgi:hypothetical protein